MMNFYSLSMGKILSLLGIVIATIGLGVSLSIISSYKQSISMTTKQFEKNIIYVSNAYSNKFEKSLSMSDIERLKNVFPEIIKISPILNYGVRLNGINGKFSSSIVGLNKDMLDMLDIKMKYGKKITALSVKNTKNICLITDDLIERLFGVRSPIGEKIKILNQEVTIIGVVDNGNKSPFVSYKETIFLPETIARKFFYSGNKISTIAIFAKTNDNKKFSTKIKIFFNLQSIGKNVKIWSLEEILSKKKNILKITEWFITIILSIILLTTALNSINTLLLSLQERKKELGIRMALGATTKDIVLLLLKENSIIFFIGGVIGFFIGIGISFLLEQQIRIFLSIPSIHIEYQAIIMYLFWIWIYSLCIIAFPAYKVSKLEPINIIRE